MRLLRFLVLFAVLCVLLYADGSNVVQKKKSKKMRHRMKDSSPNVAENKQELQDFVESNTVHQFSVHGDINVSDKRVESRAELTNSQKHADKKRNKTHSVISDGVASSEHGDASKIVGQCQKVKTKIVATSDTDQHADSQINQQLEPVSGIKNVFIPVSIDILLFVKQLSDSCLVLYNTLLCWF